MGASSVLIFPEQNSAIVFGHSTFALRLRTPVHYLPATFEESDEPVVQFRSGICLFRLALIKGPRFSGEMGRDPGKFLLAIAHEALSVPSPEDQTRARARWRRL